MFINNLSQNTEIAVMPIQGKNSSNIFSGTAESIAMKVGR